jgi:hypothetical protein
MRLRLDNTRLGNRRVNLTQVEDATRWAPIERKSAL